MSFDSAKSDWSGTASGGDDSSVSKLPDDLQILAEQLSGDAQFLAERYPATAAAERFAKAVEMQIAASQTATVGRWRLWQKLVAAVVLVAIGSAGTAVILDLSNSNGSRKTDLMASSDAGTSKTQSGESNSARGNENVQSFGVQAVGLNTAPAPRTNLSEVEMLRIQSAAFEQVIRKLQDELARRDKQQTEMQQTLESLRDEVHDLRQRINESQPSTKDAK